MAKSVLAPVKPELLVWARKSASVTAADAARAAGVDEARLAAWEAGAERPSLPKLRQLAEKYKRPLAVMLLPKPPRDFQPLRDFRRVAPGTAMPARVAYEIRAAQERRETALDLARDLDSEIQRFSLRARVSEDPEDVGVRVRRILGITGSEHLQAARRNKVFELWRSAIEAKGILVFVMGGAHAPAVREVRGFAIPADQFPVIAVNGRDKTNGRTFTLLHELAHLLLGESAVENAVAPTRSMPPPVRAIERFCNAVAAATLMPSDQIRAEAGRLEKDKSAEWSDAELIRVAEKLGVSREALLLRMVERGFASRRFYSRKRSEFELEYSALDEPTGNSAPVPPYNVVVGRYGRPYARLVIDGYRGKRITMSDAAGLLGVQAKYIGKVERQAYYA